jgi:hypothetical protein
MAEMHTILSSDSFLNCPSPVADLPHLSSLCETIRFADRIRSIYTILEETKSEIKFEGKSVVILFASGTFKLDHVCHVEYVPSFWLAMLFKGYLEPDPCLENFTIGDAAESQMTHLQDVIPGC